MTCSRQIGWMIMLHDPTTPEKVMYPSIGLGLDKETPRPPGFSEVLHPLKNPAVVIITPTYPRNPHLSF